VSYLTEWRKKIIKAQEEERKRDREKRGVKVIVIGGPKK
jgi:hypothetical protein